MSSRASLTIRWYAGAVRSASTDRIPASLPAIHRAIYGSLERFIGILTEHFAGAFPFWCAPVQAVVVPIAERHNEAARDLGRGGELTGEGRDDLCGFDFAGTITVRADVHPGSIHRSGARSENDQ